MLEVLVFKGSRLRWLRELLGLARVSSVSVHLEVVAARHYLGVVY